MNIDNITKLKQISPFLGDIDFGKSDEITGSKVQLLLKIMELQERRQNILKCLKNDEKIELHPIEILYEILRLVLHDLSTGQSKISSIGKIPIESLSEKAFPRSVTLRRFWERWFSWMNFKWNP